MNQSEGLKLFYKNFHVEGQQLPLFPKKEQIPPESIEKAFSCQNPNYLWDANDDVRMMGKDAEESLLTIEFNLLNDTSFIKAAAERISGYMPITSDIDLARNNISKENFFIDLACHIFYTRALEVAKKIGDEGMIKKAEQNSVAKSLEMERIYHQK